MSGQGSGTPAAGELITLAQMKRHLRVDPALTADDEIIADLITAAREWVEQYTRRALVQQTRTEMLTHVSGDIRLKRTPVISITEIASIDSTGAVTVLSPATYTLANGTEDQPLARAVESSFTAGSIRIMYVAGSADGEAPVRLVQAMKLWAEAHYDRDQYMMPILLNAANALADPLRVSVTMA
jgi:uncharacterized phiE125 gp8 family phage protein